MASSHAIATDLDLAAVLARLDAIEARLAALEQRGRRPVRPEDAAALVRLASYFGESIFTAADALPLLADRWIDTAASSGCWLRRMARHPGGGLRLHRLPRCGAGTRWRIATDADGADGTCIDVRR